MRVFQSTYKDRHGKTTKTERWYIEFSDHRERQRRLPGFSDRKQTEALGRRICDLVSFKVSGQTLPPDVSRWIEGLPARLQKALGNIGLLDAGKVAALRPLLEHLDGAADAPGWKQYLESKANTAGHITKSCGMVRRITNGCEFVYWSDVAASKLTAFLTDLRADKKDAAGNVKRGISAQTFNYHLTAFKSFCKWMVADGRATVSPVLHLTGLNAKADRRKVRRALSVDEIRWLLDITRKGPEHEGMSGTERALLYRVALETGLRRGELSSLTRGSFKVDGSKPSVTVAAAYSKHRREDVLPLRADTAAELGDFLAAKMPGAVAFNIPKRRHDSAGMFRADLAAARKAWLENATTPQERAKREGSTFLSESDSAGAVADFHALRHTAGSLLAASGAHPKVAQAVMRHCDINLTMSRYTHVYAGQEADAVAALPDLSTPVMQSAKATGSLDARPFNDAGKTGDSVLAFCLAQKGGFQSISVDSVGRKASDARSEENPCEIEGNAIVSGPESTLAGVAELADAQDSKS